jgi:hypothetical protein
MIYFSPAPLLPSTFQILKVVCCGLLADLEGGISLSGSLWL